MTFHERNKKNGEFDLTQQVLLDYSEILQE